MMQYKDADPILIAAARLLRIGARMWPFRREWLTRQAEVVTKVARRKKNYKSWFNLSIYFALGVYGALAILAALLAIAALFISKHFYHEFFSSIMAVFCGGMVWAGSIGIGIGNRWINKREERQTPRYHRWVFCISITLGLVSIVLVLKGRHVI